MPDMTLAGQIALICIGFVALAGLGYWVAGRWSAAPAQRRRRAAMSKAGNRSLSWLSSYRGGGALGAYDEMREALRARVAELEALVRDEADCCNACAGTGKPWFSDHDSDCGECNH